MVMPQPGLEEVNKISHDNGTLVIYDEVITAFRFHYGAAQDLLGVKPDLTAFGKIVGGGLPIGATVVDKILWSTLHHRSSLSSRNNGR